MNPPDRAVAAPLDAALVLTAILLLLRPSGPFYIRFALIALATIALLAPSIRRDWMVWLAAAGAVAAGIVADWPMPDNHIYLLAYWCLALSLALGGAEPEAVIARSARWLIGLAFLCAVVWKGLLSPDYLDGRFFTVTLLIDDRFADAVMLVSGMREADVVSARQGLQALPHGAALADGPAIVVPSGVRAMAAVLTWGGLAIETATAALFLWGGERLRRLRLVVLLIFCVATYALAPVTGFGCLLLAMGMVACRSTERGLQAAFVAGFVLVLFYTEVPWAGLIRP